MRSLSYDWAGWSFVKERAYSHRPLPLTLPAILWAEGHGHVRSYLDDLL